MYWTHKFEFSAMDKEISYENVDNSSSYKKPWRHSPHPTVTYSLCGIKEKERTAVPAVSEREGT